jgi:osmotically-inducible protein OsmY
MKSDGQIERDVSDELQWDPDVDASNIAVSVTGGVVELAGYVKTYSDKFEAESATKRVAGVRGLANDLEVRITNVDQRPDPEIARSAASALRNRLPISSENIKVIVKDGWVTLEGEVEWQHQRAEAETAVRRLQGVTGVYNDITLKPKVVPADIQQRIQAAIKRLAQVDATGITVEGSGSAVTLNGTVRSWAERDEAERTAWAAPGVTEVADHLVVNP